MMLLSEPFNVNRTLKKIYIYLEELNVNRILYKIYIYWEELYNNVEIAFVYRNSYVHKSS
jgi:hypothetical protein